MNDDTLPEEVRKAYQEAHDALEFVETKMEETTTKTPPGRAEMGQETAVAESSTPKDDGAAAASNITSARDAGNSSVSSHRIPRKNVAAGTRNAESFDSELDLEATAAASTAPGRRSSPRKPTEAEKEDDDGEEAQGSKQKTTKGQKKKARTVTRPQRRAARPRNN